MIGIEFTDVIAEYSQSIINAIKEKYNLTFDSQEIQSAHFHKLFMGEEEDIKRIRWLNSMKKNPEFILGLQPVDGFFEFWNGKCAESYAKRIIVPDFIEENTVYIWLNRYKINAGINVIKQVDGWQRQTKSRWIISSNRKWLASVEEQAIAFRAPDAVGIYARSFLDVEKIICQNNNHE